MRRWQTYTLAGLTLTLIVVGLGLKGGRGVEALIWKADELLAAPVASVKHTHINYGVYDPVFVADAEPAFADKERVAIEHIFVSWLGIDASAIASAFAYANARDRWLMITVEPFMDNRTPTHTSFLPAIARGDYDAEIVQVCQAIGNLGAPVFIRWGHEMEAASARYPWAGQDPDAFIAAYRHFVGSCKRVVGESFYVWSPRGDNGLEPYYPGRAYVDYVGVSLYAFPAFDLDVHGRVRSFVEAFEERYRRIEQFDRPAMIAELGVTGDPAYQEAWMRGLFRNAAKFPLLKTAVYFNAIDSPGAWPDKYGIPDWSISSEVFE
jgi:cellulose synthase (UDP-forming)